MLQRAACSPQPAESSTRKQSSQYQHCFLCDSLPCCHLVAMNTWMRLCHVCLSAHLCGTAQESSCQHPAGDQYVATLTPEPSYDAQKVQGPLACMCSLLLQHSSYHSWVSLTDIQPGPFHMQPGTNHDSRQCFALLSARHHLCRKDNDATPFLRSIPRRLGMLRPCRCFCTINAVLC